MLPRTTQSALALACTAAALVTLSACGSSSGAKTTTDAAAAKKPVTISYWSWTGNSQAVVDEFNKTHTDVHVDFTQIPTGTGGGYQKIFDAIKAGTAPDIFNCEYQALPDFASQGDLQDLTASITPALKAGVATQAWNMSTLGGETWSVPFDFEPTVLYYRKDLFKKYGLTVPTTWAQYQADAQKLKAADPKAALAEVSPDDQSFLEALAWANGAQWFTTQGSSWKVNLDDAPTQQVTAYWQHLIGAGLVKQQLLANTTTITADLKNNLVLTQIAATSNASNLVTTLPSESGDWAIAPLPSFNGQASTGMQGGSSIAVTKSSKQLAADMEFATWYATNADAAKTKLGTNGPSLSFAAPTNEAAAAKLFNTSYFGGQDVYGLFSTVTKSVNPNWVWGPVQTDTNAVLKSEFAKVVTGGTFAAGLQAGQTQTLSDMKARGLSVSAG